jgi:hypothetical protein
MPPDDAPQLTQLLAAYTTLHRDIMSGRRPPRYLVTDRCDEPGVCGGIGDRMKGLRLLFYTAVMTGRALLLPRWQGVALDDVVLPHTIDWRVPSHIEDLIATASAAATTPSCALWPYLCPLMDLAFGPAVVVSSAMFCFELDHIAAEVTDRLCVDSPGAAGYGNLRPSRSRRLAVEDWWPRDHFSGGSGSAGGRGRSNSTRRHCSDRSADVAGSAERGGGACVPHAVFEALFQTNSPLPFGAMMDYLFKPHPDVVENHLLPLLQLDAWKHTGLRVGAHFRSLVADGERFQ